MWNSDRHQVVILPPRKGFSTPSPASRNTKAASSRSSVSISTPLSDSKRHSPANKRDLYHVIHKVPAGDSPYVRAKHVQLIEKDPSRAISLFWSAINAGDRVDSALKDMAVVMKQLNRSDEAIEAIKSFRHLCPLESQESLDNVLVELYKRAGRMEEEVEMLKSKLERIDEGLAFGGRRTKTARSQGKKVIVSVIEEKSRILGNLAWAYLQQNNYETAQEYYRRALELEPDNNKQCNLAVCLLHLNRIPEAKSLLHAVKVLCGTKPMDESFAKSFERGCQLLRELGTELEPKPIEREFYSGNHFEHKVNAQDDIAALESMNMRFGSFEIGNNLEYLRQPVTVDQLKRNRTGVNGTEAQARSSWQRNTDPQSGPWQRRERFSPAPFTQPRRCLWGFSDGDRTKEDWRKRDSYENNDLKKLSADEVMTEEEFPLPGSNTETPSSTIDSTLPYKKKSWADMAEEEEDGVFDFFESPCLMTQMKNDEDEVFADENANWNITQESPYLQTQMKRVDQFGTKDEYISPGLREASSKNQPVRRALFFDHGKPTGKSPFRGKNVRMMRRRNRLKVFQDITQSS